MSMRLRVSDLDDITAAVRKAQEILEKNGVEINSIKIGMHTVFMSAENLGGQTNKEIVIVGITDKNPGQGGYVSHRGTCR